MRVLVAAIQMTSGVDVPSNLARAAELVARAARRGAELVVLPEDFAHLPPSDDAPRCPAEDLERPGPILRAMAETARGSSVWLVCGGLPERIANGDGREHNTCVVLAPDGRVAAAYRKIHLFDARLPDGVEHRESHRVAPGAEAVVAALPWGGLGLSVCYDVRFPELYRALAARGACALVVPAAFTLHTGKDHWHLLLRARAVENLAFVIAAAQYGEHHPDRRSYGHSLIVDPWGTVLAEASDGEGVVLAELDLERQRSLRRDLPVLAQRRL